MHAGDKWLIKDIHDSSKPVMGMNVISIVSYQHATEVQRGWGYVMGFYIHSGIGGSQEGSRNYLEADCRKRALIAEKETPSLACSRFKHKNVESHHVGSWVLVTGSRREEACLTSLLELMCLLC